MDFKKVSLFHVTVTEYTFVGNMTPWESLDKTSHGVQCVSWLD